MFWPWSFPWLVLCVARCCTAGGCEANHTQAEYQVLFGVVDGVRSSKRGLATPRKEPLKSTLVDWFWDRSYIYIYTSSTAQGGGGSFKNRKPIGEVRGRESGMAERSHCWTERRLISLSLLPSTYPPTYLPTYLPTYPQSYVSIHLSIHLSVYPSSHLSLYPSIYLFIHLSIYPSIHLFVYLSIYQSIHLSIYPFIFLSIYLSIYRSIVLSIYLSSYLAI